MASAFSPPKLKPASAEERRDISLFCNPTSERQWRALGQARVSTDLTEML
jgi:hypothetical protein